MELDGRAPRRAQSTSIAALGSGGQSMKALGMMCVVLSLGAGCDAGTSGGSQRTGDANVPPAECPFPLDTCASNACDYDVAVCEDACANLSDALADCSADVDMTMCMTACTFSIAESRCANILFGCASENDTCDDYESCQNDKFEEPAGTDSDAG
jgi:hypothetical protein